MDISFGDSKLEKYANDDKKAIKKLGPARAKVYKTRLDDIKASDTLEDVKHLPGKFHELKGDKKGYWACNLDHPYRLIFKPQEDPIPTNKDGQYLWIEIKGIEITEISDYH